MYVYVILCVAFFAFVYMVIRGLKLKTLNHLLKMKEYDRLIEFAQQASNRRMLKAYICDLYVARALVRKKDLIALKEHLHGMFQQNYPDTDRTTFLTLYFHMFMEKRDIAFADEILQEIVKTKDQASIQYCQWTRDVIMDGRVDLIKDMEDVIEQKKYDGFPLGVIVYLIALQYKAVHNDRDALLWFETSLEAFHKNDIYVETIHEEILALKKQT